LTRRAAAEIGSALQTVLDHLAKPDVDVAWSSYPTADAAIAEVEDVRRAVLSRDAAAVPRLSLLFAPTGPLQEISLSSGWGQAFVDLASLVDAALARS
jgi:hypothetical protein